MKYDDIGGRGPTSKCVSHESTRWKGTCEMRNISCSSSSSVGTGEGGGIGGQENASLT